jgi:hypothetical protein
MVFRELAEDVLPLKSNNGDLFAIRRKNKDNG